MKTKPKKGAVGRRKYVPSEEHFQTCLIGSRKGFNYSEISKSIGISLKTFQRNINLFSPHLKKGLDESDDRNCEKIEAALIKRCVGFEYVEDHTEKRVGDAGKVIFMHKKQVKKFHPPSDVAIFFYLCNRASDRWQSINRPVIDKDDSRGEIQGWFSEMRKQYDKLKKPKKAGSVKKGKKA